MRSAAVSLLGALLLACSGCGGSSTPGDSDAETFLADALTLLPDHPQLRGHVLVADLSRLRRTYTEPEALRDALVAVWLPDALAGADRNLWDRTFGLRLADVTSFASAGFHPAEVAVVDGAFDPAALRSALARAGYRPRAGVLARNGDGALDATTEAGRLALSSLNRITESPKRLTAASTTALLAAAGSRGPTLASHELLAAAAAALDPVTSAVLLDADLVRPPRGVPTQLVAQHPARIVGAGIDDAGARERMLKIVLVYEDAKQARADASEIERTLDSIPLAGAPGSRFADVAPAWQIESDDRTILITALLPPETPSGIWRSLVERGDLGALVRPRSAR